MTEPERIALDHIRQVVDSVIGVPAPPAPPSSGMSPSILPVPYFSDLDEETKLTFSDSGAAAGVMLVRAYAEGNSDPRDFYSHADQDTESPLSFTQIMNGLSAQGVQVELRSNLKLADLSLILFSGRPVIAPIEQSVLTESGLMKEAFIGPYYVVVVGMDVKHVFIHDPLRKDSSGQAQGISWLTFYQAWSQAEGYVRAVLVPRQQLIRRVRVTDSEMEIYEQPGGGDASPAGTASPGDLFEVTQQKNGWGKISEDRWINLSHTTDI